MSFWNSLLNEIAEDLNTLNRPTRYLLGDLHDQHFGLGLGPSDFPTNRVPHLPALRAGYLRSWRNVAPPKSGISSVRADNNGFTVRLDVSHFKPDELQVQLDENGYVVVEAKHEERLDEHGLVARHFTRRYKLPESVNNDTLESCLSTDGILTITAARKTPSEALGRSIKIIQTNLPSPLPEAVTQEKKELSSVAESTDDQTESNDDQ
uniref:Heat shock protein 20-5 n=1 Tax=Tytthus chinensis TaxID=981288 RepID=A0A346THP5_9HEMI|nr:heat shock protein 20-5 [Tytthus chinensis]